MSRFPRSRHLRFAAMVGALGVATVACVQPGDATVGLDKVQARLVFGVKELTKPAPLPTESIQAQAEILDVELLPFELTDNEVELIPQPATQPQCPKAAYGTPIDPYADQNITGMPKEGIYLWRFEVINGTKAGTNEDNVVLEKYFERAVRNVVKVSDTVYSFEVLEPDHIHDVYNVYTYQVRTDGQTTVVDPPNVVGVVEYPRVGDPERGLVLKRHSQIDKNGNPASTPGFRALDPVTGLLILPLEVAPGENFQSVAVDRRTGDTIVADTFVENRDVVDACGTPTSAWYVYANGTRTNSDNPRAQHSYKWNYWVATQFGGMMVKERTEYVPPGSSIQITQSTIASLTPRPLPDALK